MQAILTLCVSSFPSESLYDIFMTHVPVYKCILGGHIVEVVQSLYVTMM